MDKQTVCITGSGVICAIGNTPGAVEESLRRQESGVGNFRHLDSCRHELPVGEVTLSDRELKEKLGIDPDKEASRTALLGAYALRSALYDAGLNASDLQGRRVVLISGTTVGGMDVTERHFATDTDPSYIMHHDCGTNTREIADMAGLDCDTLTISTACSSALNAISIGTRMLLADEADIVIAGGSEALTRFHLNGFNSLMILDTERCRPFDATRRGLNLGEGAAFVVLRKGSGEVEGAQAYIAGYGNRCDAFHQTATSADGEGAFLAMTDALEMANVAPEQVAYINAHGTGTPDNDRSESAALKRVFGAKLPPVSSTKSFTGHTTSASGAIETVISVMALRTGFLPCSLGCTQPDSDCIRPTEGTTVEGPQYVLCNSFGFGGNDSSLLLGISPASLPVPDKSAQGECVAAERITEVPTAAEVKGYVAPMEARRMGKLLKAATLTSLRALENAGVEKPDAIVIGTRFGMLDEGEKILEHIAAAGEEGLSPTLFMQSTHNTIAGSLAIRLGCHGYNVTISNGQTTRNDVIAEANRLIREGIAETVLAGVHDYLPDKFLGIYRSGGGNVESQLDSEAIIIKKA